MTIEVQSLRAPRGGFGKFSLGIAAAALLLTACAKEQDVNAFVDPNVPADQT